MLTRKLLYLTLAIILLSPLAYYRTGIGQRAATLSAEPVVQADGSLQNSPKALALHRLALPMRVERLLLYPLFLLLLQYSGLAGRLRRWIAQKVEGSWKDGARFAALQRGAARLSKGKISLAGILTTALFLTLISIIITLVYLPFAVYSGLVLRLQFGLSTQTLSAWTRDFAVSWGLNWLTTLILYGSFYGLLNLAPRRWPIWAGIGFTLFTFGYILLEPLVITPLFYQITPVTDPVLRRRINVLAQRAGIVIDDISIINASSKTTTINAYFTGFGNASKIVLWDTLLQKHPPDEVDVVIAHEMGHWVHRHMLLYALGGSAGVWLGFFVLRWWFNRVWRKLGWRNPGDVASFPYLLGIVALVTALTLPLVNGVSRFAEAQADDFALSVSQKPEAAVTMFERFARENLAMITVSPWEKIVFYTHPPLSERIAAAQKYLAKSTGSHTTKN